MKLRTEDGGWSPYLAGALVGVLAILSVMATMHWLEKPHYLGASTTFVRAAGYVGQAVAPEHVAANEYYTKERIKLDWQFMLVIGIFFGALASSLFDKSFRWESVPPIWRQRFGSSVVKRGIGAFGGGIVAMVGARLAGGCPSGHGLSGMMQLSVSGFTALGLFFLTGMLVALLVYRRSAS